MRIDASAAEEERGKRPAMSKSNADWQRIGALMTAGRDRAGTSLEAKFDPLGRGSTLVIRAKCL